MTTGLDVVLAARTWIGTPYLHGQSRKLIGCDCAVGLIGGVIDELGLIPDFWTRILPFRGYDRNPPAGFLEATCDEFMARVDTRQVGDVLALTFEEQPLHLGFLADYVYGGSSIVHALSKRGVREHRLSKDWQAKVTHAWRLPGVA